MKIKFLYSVLAVWLLAACSSDEIPAPAPKPVPESLDTYISLGVSDKLLSTRAASDDPSGTADVNTLTVAVFRGKPTPSSSVEGETPATPVEAEGSLVYFKTFNSFIESSATGASQLCKSNAVKFEDGSYQVNGIKVKAGNLSLVVMANVTADFSKVKTLSDLKTISFENLANEGFNVLHAKNKATSFPSSMTSEIISIQATPSESNEVYYVLGNQTEKATETGGTGDDRTFNIATGTGSIGLTRNVSAICLRNLSFRPLPSNISGVQAKLDVKKVFVANVLNVSPLFTPASATDFSGYNFSDYFVCGDKAYASELNLPLKEKKNTPVDYLGIEIPTSLLASSETTASMAQGFKDPACVVRPFMVYENSSKMNLGGGNQTLLIVQADYYIDKEDAEPTYKDRYYSVIINDKTDISNGNTTNGKLVERNYIYSVDLLIQGPGSKTPYEPLYSANMVAKVAAAEWTAAFNYTPEGPGLE